MIPSTGTRWSSHPPQIFVTIQTAVTVRIGDVGVVLSDPADWLSGWRRADPRLLCRLLVWLAKVVSPAVAR
jgi:hypothetical protein